MKRTGTIVLAVMLSLVFCVTAFAGSWKQDTKGWQYQNDDGLKSQGKWQFIDGNWYFFHTDGYMAANQWEGNYYLGATGAMLTNTTTPDGKKVGADGAMIQSSVSTDLTDNQKAIMKQIIQYYNDGRKTHNTKDMTELEAAEYMRSLITEDTNTRCDSAWKGTSRDSIIFADSVIKTDDGFDETCLYNKAEVIKRTYDILGVSVSEAAFAEAYLGEENGCYVGSRTGEEEGTELKDSSFELNGDTVTVHCTWDCWNNIDEWNASNDAVFKKNNSSFFGYTLKSF